MKNARAVFVCVIVASIAANSWWRGPFFGLVPYLLFTLPPALVIALLMAKLRCPRSVSLPLGVAAAVFVSYMFCAPPRTSHLFARYLGTDIPDDVRDLRRWNDNWARDPAYFLRFRTSAETVERIARCAGLSQVREGVPPPFSRSISGVPEWWSPDELRSPRIWRNDANTDWFGIVLRFDAESGLVYVEVMTL